MTLNFELSRKDLVAGTRAVSSKLLKWFFIVCFATAAIAAISNIRNALADGNASGLIAALFPVVILGLLLGLLLWLSPYLAARKIVIRPVEWQFNDDGVRIRSPGSSAEIKWEVFIKYRETKSLFLLYPQKNMAHMIPKRILDDAQLIELRTLIASHVKKA